MTTTSGHLASNGGIRGHSAGDILPFIVCMVGSKWRIMNPDGSLRKQGYNSSKVICPLARELKRIWNETGEY
jgi:hypothetical protein